MNTENKPDPKPHHVNININGTTFSVHPGNHPVAQLRKLPEPDIAKEEVLCQMIDGDFRPLDDKAHVDILGGEVFASNCPSGGAS